MFRRDGTLWIATGSPGGRRNGTTVVQQPRVHSQLLPEPLAREPGISPDTLRRLAQRGHGLWPSAATWKPPTASSG